jgi:hypothetical protein
MESTAFAIGLFDAWAGLARAHRLGKPVRLAKPHRQVAFYAHCPPTAHSPSRIAYWGSASRVPGFVEDFVMVVTTADLA